MNSRKKAGKERRRDAADGQDGSQKEEHAEEQKDTEGTEATAVPEKNKTESVAAVAVAAALKDKVEERGWGEEEGGKQGTAERKKAEGAGTSQGIQGRGLPQEKDDDDGFRMSRQRRRRASRRKKRREIKVRALLRRHRGLQRQRKQARQRQVGVWKLNHALHPCSQMSSKQLT